jgi:hypothetical protein
MSGCVNCDTVILGDTEAAPLVIGEPNDADAVRYRVDLPVFGRLRGSHLWATGDGVDAFTGILVPGGL